MAETSITEYAQSFIQSLVTRFPKLSPLLEEHLGDQFGELLPHVFFGDVTRHVIKLIRDGSPVTIREAQEIIDFLETSYGHADSYVQNLLQVSFLENLQQEGTATDAAEKMLGPLLTKALCELEAHWEDMYHRKEKELESGKTKIGFKVGDKADK